MQAVKWGEYRLGDLFEVLSYKKRFDANKVTLVGNGGHPYIVRQGSDNGQKGFIDEDKSCLNDGNTISFGQDTATMFYQEKPYFTGDKIKILKPKLERFGKDNAQFFLATMRRSFSNFGWGTSSFSIEVIENQTITLPVTDNNEIDFDFMESFIRELEEERIRELEEERIRELSAYLTVSGLADATLTANERYALECFDKLEWKEFRLGDLFDRVSTVKLPYKAANLPKEPTAENPLPCLTSSFMNQGLNYYVPKEKATVLKDVISIPSNSDVYRAYYQSHDFTVLSDAYAVRWNWNDKEISAQQYLFMVACINQVTDLPIYSYKNKLGGWNVVKNKYIMLPVRSDTPDYEAMQNFICAVQKLVINDVVQYTNKKIEATKKVTNTLSQSYGEVNVAEPETPYGEKHGK